MDSVRSSAIRSALVACFLCAGTIALSKPPYRVAEPLREPVLFAEGVISTGEFESHPAFTPDGRTFYFVRSTPAFTDWKIYVTRFGSDGWSPPKLAPFSGKHRDADPFITADGKHLYFISDRPVGDTPKQDMDIWVMDRMKNGEWAEPRNLGAPVNTSGNEWFPKLSAKGALYFGSDRPGGHGRTDLYRARPSAGSFVDPENLGQNINTSADEYEGCIAEDESFIVFMAAERAGGLGSGDLFISYRKDGSWTPAKGLGPRINGRGLEISPYLSPDNRYFFFSSARIAGEVAPDQRPNRTRNGLGDIYQMEVGAIHEGIK